MIKAIILETLTDVLIVAMAANLLYLYFTGGWCEPIVAILISELVLLFLAIIFGCYRFIRFMRRIEREVF